MCCSFMVCMLPVVQEFGTRGGIEMGFLSATTERSVALGYARHERKVGILFEMEQGMIDRGASLSWLSQ